MRLIDADALAEELMEQSRICGRRACNYKNEPKIFYSGKSKAYEVAADHVRADCPTVDAVLVRHGKWGQIGIKVVAGYLCSECHLSIGASDYKRPSPYCPNCGAKMDADVEKTGTWF